MTFQARVTLDANKVIGENHPHLYGANLEHIGRSVYGGHWAEMLKSRKFAGHDRMYIGLSEGLRHQNPSYGIVLPWVAVNPHYENVLFVHDQSTFYTSAQSQRITIRRSDGLEHGIQQSGLTLQAGRSYDLRLVLKGEGQAVTVALAEQRWAIPSVGAEWATYTHRFDVTEEQDDAALSILVQEEGSLWIGCASLMPSDHLNGHRADVVAALKEWTPTFMRWPGGNFASGYHWQKGIGDQDQRPSYLDPAWNLWEPNDVGTDEFMDLCRMVGSEPILTINMGTGTPAEAAAWVEYCNGDAASAYGAIRAANGHPEPYHVKTWFVGNEQFGNWQVGHCDAETYARRYLEYVAAMRAVDPDLRLIAVGVPVDLYGHWNELVLKNTGGDMDALSVHYYSIRTELWDEPPPANELYWPKVAAAHEVALMLDQTLAIMDASTASPVALAFDEWNTYVAGKAPDFFEDYNMADALYTGAVMNTCLERCDRIVMSAVFNLINVMGNYRVTPRTIWKTPSSLVQELFTRFRGTQSIACSIDCPQVSTPGAGNLPAFEDLPLISAAATLDAASRMIYLSVVNRDPQRTAEIHLDGVQRNAETKIYRVAGDGPFALNTEDQPKAVRIEAATWPAEEEALRLPPHSMNMLLLQF